jgi:isopentenyl-diphosphate Delta-isomerase
MKKIKPIVLVDKNDKVLGLKEKMSCHKSPVPLHRAVSVVIYNKDGSQMLITKRSRSKPTWGGVWSNAVCSHPFPYESYQKAAKRRLKEELGIRTPLKDVVNFTYKAKMQGDIWGECELDHVFIGKYIGAIKPDSVEIDGYEWIDVKTLKEDIKKNSKKYTPWFKMILDKIEHN